MSAPILQGCKRRGPRRFARIGRESKGEAQARDDALLFCRLGNGQEVLDILKQSPRSRDGGAATRCAVSAEHVGRDAVVPADAFLVGLLAQGRVFAVLADEAVGLGDLLVGRLVGRADLDAVLRGDQ